MHRIDVKTIEFVRTALAKETKKSEIAEKLHIEMKHSIAVAYKIIREVEIEMGYKKAA